MNITPIIGLEIHVELKTRTKMFCSCSAEHFQAKPNTHLCPTCLGLPGALPVVNKEAVRKTIQVGTICNCIINPVSHFERKNYFYPDLFKGYQVTQYEIPICSKGYIDIVDKDGKFQKRIGLARIHMEEDVAKMTHNGDASLIDGNKAGVPLIEIVSLPDMNSATEAVEYAKLIHQAIRFIDASDVDMEKGQMRFDINVNLQVEKDGSIFATPIVEVKNVNSFRALGKAIAYEITRQTEAFEKDGEILQKGNKVTRGWDDETETTTFHRSKEEANDYRYVPEPDIPPLQLPAAFITDSMQEVTLNLFSARTILIERYGLSLAQAVIMARSKELYTWFTNVVDNAKLEGTFVANWAASDLLNFLNADAIEVNESKMTAENFAYIMKELSEKKLTNTQAKQLIKTVYQTGKDAKDIIEEEGMRQVNDVEVIEHIAQRVVDDNPQIVETIRQGKVSALQFLVGLVMKESKGSANPQTVMEILKQKVL